MTIVAWGDSAITIEFEERIDAAVNASVVALADSIAGAAIVGVRDVVPTFRSVTVYFDPLKTDRADLMKRIDTETTFVGDCAPKPGRVLRIPVCYGNNFGPDLTAVAEFAQADESRVIALHAAPLYRVYMLGFVPGFAYMAPVDQRIAMPRLASPRMKVPMGSVAIAGIQTAVYPSDIPGGWHLVGRTPVKPYDPLRRDPFLFTPGDAVQFYPIDPEEYERAERFTAEDLASCPSSLS